MLNTATQPDQTTPGPTPPITIPSAPLTSAALQAARDSDEGAEDLTQTTRALLQAVSRIRANPLCDAAKSGLRDALAAVEQQQRYVAEAVADVRVLARRGGVL